MRLILPFFLLAQLGFAAEPEFPLTADSKPQPSVPKGTIIKDSYTAMEGSVFPGTQREYQIYLPAGHDKTKPAAFMVFQDGVIYQAPFVFDNLIAKKDIPPLVGIFIKPGVVPAANENALPRFNRSYEYDSITPTYSQFLIDEFLPAIEAKHGVKLSTDPNHAAISGNSSGGICAFMTAWHRPDRFRRVFTGVGTYVGIHGADQLPVLVRKFEPKPLRIFLQSDTGDNNLYCGDWWMANQMMERSLTWAGYDVNHAWGEGGHNQKHASQIFPDVLRWLWRDWQTNIEVKANPKGESKWKGYEVVENTGKWRQIFHSYQPGISIVPNVSGSVAVLDVYNHRVSEINHDGTTRLLTDKIKSPRRGAWFKDTLFIIAFEDGGTQRLVALNADKEVETIFTNLDNIGNIAVTQSGTIYMSDHNGSVRRINEGAAKELPVTCTPGCGAWIVLSPDQTMVFGTTQGDFIRSHQILNNGKFVLGQNFVELESSAYFPEFGLCVDTDGWLYVATSIGIQVCDQAGRVNFIIPTPEQPYDVCFGGKDLSELFIACGDSIYKRPTKAKGVVSGQQAPIKPAPPKL